MMSVGYVPEALKNAIITPVYKHGPAEMPKKLSPDIINECGRKVDGA